MPRWRPSMRASRAHFHRESWRALLSFSTKIARNVGFVVCFQCGHLLLQLCRVRNLSFGGKRVVQDAPDPVPFCLLLQPDRETRGALSRVAEPEKPSPLARQELSRLSFAGVCSSAVGTIVDSENGAPIRSSRKQPTGAVGRTAADAGTCSRVPIGERRMEIPSPSRSNRIDLGRSHTSWRLPAPSVGAADKSTEAKEVCCRIFSLV